ncbi:hypothetical protein [Mycolicibacterium mengxianglii]|uniref:hypothetical protein n=1 Tax=Mycolicibacterium mengxianglii TaxID=2736649 RepID=UPI001E38871E|nr:hypothetical protein [Mycolicibacterium mengxianglii]
MAPQAAAVAVKPAQPTRAVVSAPEAAATVSSVLTPTVARATVATVTPVVSAPGPPLPNPIIGVLNEVFGVVNTLILPNPAVPPSNPLHVLVYEIVRRIEIELGLPVVGTPIVVTPSPVTGALPVSTTGAGVPSAGDEVQTPYGSIGKWMLQPSGQISQFGGQRVDGKQLLEPINVIIVDQTSSSPEEAIAKLNASMGQAGFPAQAIHSTGLQGYINGDTYGQQPAGFLQAYSNNFFLLPDDHARAFGPAVAVDGVGYVWTVSASREQIGLIGILPTHVYLSYNAARDELTNQLVLSGATLVGAVPLNNSIDGASATQTVGDHDGYALVVQLA